MRTLGRAARRMDKSGTFLPDVFLPLSAKGIKFREGTVNFIAGTPGSMKTGLALYLVGRWGRPTLYFSADSEPFEMVERLASMATGDTVSKVRADYTQYADVLAALPIRMTFEDSPTYEDVFEEVAAYVEVYGGAPEVIVIDNVMNLTGENENEWGAHRDHARVIHKICRVTGATVIVLAHMGEDTRDPSGKPAPRTKLQGKISQLPKMILSLAFDGSVLKVAAVKNRFGPADPSAAGPYVELHCDPATNRFYNSYADKQARRAA